MSNNSDTHYFPKYLQYSESSPNYFPNYSNNSKYEKINEDKSISPINISNNCYPKYSPSSLDYSEISNFDRINEQINEQINEHILSKSNLPKTPENSPIVNYSNNISTENIDLIYSKYSFQNNSPNILEEFKQLNLNK